MKHCLSTGMRVCVIASTLLFGMSAAGAFAQTDEHCAGLKTPQLIAQDYFNGNYIQTFPCLANMIEAGDYKSNAKVWNDYMFKMIDHYFRNALNEKDKKNNYDLETILWHVMLEPRDDSAAKAVKNYKWHKNVQGRVAKALNLFNQPSAVTLSPDKVTLRKSQVAKFKATYRNRADIGLSSIKPNLEAKVDPADWGTSRVEGNEVVVTGLKAGRKVGTLTVSDKERGVRGEAELAFTGRMSVLWPIGGLAVTGGAVGVAASSDGGTATTFWIISGVSAAVTGILFYKYLRGEGVPFLSKSDSKDTDVRLAVSLVPGPKSIALNVFF